MKPNKKLSKSKNRITNTNNRRRNTGGIGGGGDHKQLISLYTPDWLVDAIDSMRDGVPRSTFIVKKLMEVVEEAKRAPPRRVELVFPNTDAGRSDL